MIIRYDLVIITLTHRDLKKTVERCAADNAGRTADTETAASN